MTTINNGYKKSRHIPSKEKELKEFIQKVNRCFFIEP